MLRNSFPRTRNCVSVSLVSLSTLFLFSVSLDSPSLASIDNSKEADCGANQRKQSIAFTFFSWRLLSDSLTRKLRLLLRNLQSAKESLLASTPTAAAAAVPRRFLDRHNGFGSFAYVQGTLAILPGFFLCCRIVFANLSKASSSVCADTHNPSNFSILSELRSCYYDCLTHFLSCLLSTIVQFETSFFFDPGLLLQSIDRSRASSSSSSSLIDQPRVSLLSVPWPFRFQIHHLRLTIQSIKQSAFLSLLFPQMHTEFHQQGVRAPSLSRLPAVSSSSSQSVLLPPMTFPQKNIRKRSIDHA